ncbi:hypothetical protein AUI06_11865 [archaeon 13_2_20CM_2_52_21]|nr:MAG: hypothetical protein AUI06_11865 [archaeon 13_2_20CM_2_52_21]
MQHRKFLVPIFAVLLVGVAVPLSVPRAHGDDNSSTLNITGLLARGISDSYLRSTVDAVQAGNTLTFNVVFVASSVVYQRNLTMGIKYDWMTNFQNTTSDTAVYAGQTLTVSLAYTIPALTGQYSALNQQAHTWTLEMWNMAQGATWSVYTGCYDYNYPPPNAASCKTFSSNGYPYTYGNLAVYSSAQTSSYNSKVQAKAITDSLNAVLGSTFSPAPGTSAALALLAQANTQMTLANNAYQLGDFATAQTEYQNALNDANAAQSSLATIGGGTDTATFTSIWLDSVAILLSGIGAILVGFAGFKYLRGKTRALPGYTPSTPKA